ncbi:MAG: hypothetical protein N3E42_00070 [Candidatus Bipolaricaulota bacterium]|nr:hypothetical protein [Candidatus Bipolaricaulota bacterium]
MRILKQRWFWIGLALLALAIALTLLYGEVLREKFLRYIVYELWLWKLRLESLPFGLVWMVFLVIGGLSVYYVIIDLVLRGRHQAREEERSTLTGPVQALARKIELACHGELARWNLHRAVGEIALHWIVVREDIAEGEARRRFKEILPDLYDALELEFPTSATERGWLWLREHLPISIQQRARRLHEISQLTNILEHFAGEAYERRRDHRGERTEDLR